ncbi:MAG: hypothetical protein OEY93_01405 [Anaerolineae bacterium]|nr:hypothetical protein [Anaerolineae bacterium]
MAWQDLINWVRTQNAAIDEEQKLMLAAPMCLYEISKDMKGDIHLDPEMTHPEKCKNNLGECTTIKTIENIKMSVIDNGKCDSEISREVCMGDFSAKLMAVLRDNSDGRGYHSGRFRWEFKDLFVAQGRMSGITNAGTHRFPLLDCEPCNALAHMEGFLDGYVTGINYIPETRGQEYSRLVGSYAIQIDWHKGGMDGDLLGILEGMLIGPCG